MAYRRLLASGAVAAVLVVSGCNGGGGGKVATLGDKSSSSSASAKGKSSKESFQDALVSYTKCMREHGIDMPDPTFTSNGNGQGGFAVMGGPAGSGDGGAAGGPARVDPSKPEFQAADKACKPILDAATKELPKPSPEEMAKQRDQALAMAKCMREHGIDMPDPTFDDSGAISVHAPAGGGPSSDSNGDRKIAGPDQKFLDAAKACQKDGAGPFVTKGGPGGLEGAKS